ncbi:type I glyceraldehyde-3-phosphate dehydrogenase [Candidatus Bathyarchaeota archaeon]|nr:MAG: type I glyceraldehyde-3-phosphate dehydrogenase [Candidatus Bathyarchaeota archaeon]
MEPKVAINGFGRIGRLLFRAALEHDIPVNFVIINDLAPPEALAHLLQYDTNFGKLPWEVKVEDNVMKVKNYEIEIISQPDPEKLPWKEKGIYVAAECTGIFREREKAEKHLKAGAQKVLVSAPMRPATAADLTIVPGVNDHLYDPDKHTVLSLASCTTNCIAPVMKVLDEAFGIEAGLMTTVHAVTNDQRLLDRIHRDMRRARAAPWNIVPTTTGAAEAAALTYTPMQGKVTGIALRVPVPTVSIIDFTAWLKTDVTVDDVNTAFKEAAEKPPLKGILAYTEEPLVSSDFKKCPYSAVVDGLSTRVMPSPKGRLVKVLAWYDNEWGYSCRMAEFLKKMCDMAK